MARTCRSEMPLQGRFLGDPGIEPTAPGGPSSTPDWTRFGYLAGPLLSWPSTFLEGREKRMELVTHKKLKSGRLMPWGKGTVVIGAKGFVYLSGNTATADDYDPIGKSGGGAVGNAAAQWRAILTNIKSDLEELGSALEYLIRLTSISRWRRSALSQFSPRRAGRVLCGALPEALQLQQPAALRGDRRCSARTSRPRC